MEFDKIELQRLATQYHLRLIILFGSQSREEATARSDIDLAVLVENSETVKTPQFQLSLLFDLQRAVKDLAEVDLVILNLAAPFLKYQVAMEGKPLFENQEDMFFDFALQAMKEYEDVRHFDKYYQEIVQDFLSESDDKQSPYSS